LNHRDNFTRSKINGDKVFLSFFVYLSLLYFVTGERHFVTTIATTTTRTRGAAAATTTTFAFSFRLIFYGTNLTAVVREEFSLVMKKGRGRVYSL